MTRVASIAALVLVVGSCDFDEQMQYDIRYPATLEIENNTGQRLEISAIYSSLEAQSTFVLDGGEIDAGGSLSVRISEAVYNDIQAGNFTLRTDCNDRLDLEIQGQQLDRTAVADANTWLIQVPITSCDPPEAATM